MTGVDRREIKVRLLSDFVSGRRAWLRFVRSHVAVCGEAIEDVTVECLWLVVLQELLGVIGVQLVHGRFPGAAQPAGEVTNTLPL